MAFSKYARARAEALGLRGRQRSGVIGMAVLPEEVAHESGVDVGMRGLSAFGLPSVLRNGLRCGFGKDMLDYDQVNSHFAAAGEIATELGLMPKLHALNLVINQREMYLAEVARLSKCTRDEAKKETLATGYLQGLSPDAPVLLRDLRCDNNNKPAWCGMTLCTLTPRP